MSQENKPTPVHDPLPTVLVIDHSKAVCLHVKQILEETGQILVSYTTSPWEAITLTEQLRPTLIIQDVVFPDKDGFILLQTFRESRYSRNVPIIIFSFEQDEELRNRAFSLGANDFVAKNEDKIEFVARVLYHVKRYSQFASNGDGPSMLPSRHVVKALMIDPSRAACLRVQKALEDRGNAEFTACHDPAQAKELAEQFLPTVIIQSLSAGDFEGFSLVRTFRETPATRDVPIVVLSGTDDAAIKVKAFAEGANDYVVKSSDLAEIVSRTILHSSEYFNLLKGRFAAGEDPKRTVYPMKVMMVDDSKSICFAIGHMLNSEIDIQFTSTNDPEQATSLARSFQPTVILQDLEMPQVNGLELLARYRADAMLRDIPVIILSGTTNPKIKAKAFAEGANDYVQKDMDKIELISRLQYHTRAYVNAMRLNQALQQQLESQKRVELQREFIRKTFGRYLSDEIVQSILDSPDGLKLGGESRVITIMMADLRGFTSLSERLPAETVLTIINTFLQVMTEIIIKHGGTIDEFIGDAILAMFGAPRQGEDDAVRAVACAVEMQLAMTGVNERLAAMGHPAVAMGIGLHTGEVVVGNIGSEKRSKYGIVGRNVNLTSRIESYTVGNQIYASPQTVAACGETLLRIDDQRQVMPKGVSEPITISEIGGIAGPYNLYLAAKEELPLVPLVSPLVVDFVILEGKHAGHQHYRGRLRGLAGREGEIETEMSLQPLTNIRLSLPQYAGTVAGHDDLYAKVLTVTAIGCRVNFTSLPPEMAEVFNTLLESKGNASCG